MSELKACPFCGSDAVRGLSNGKVVCDNDDCGFSFAMYEKFWNTRPIEDELRQTIADLRADGERLVETLRVVADWDDETQVVYDQHTALYKRLEVK